MLKKHQSDLLLIFFHNLILSLTESKIHSMENLAKTIHPTPTSMFSFLLTASFIEGGAVMAVELISAKMIAPYYGQSLYVWATVIAITLGGLTTGYFLGGIISEKSPYPDTMFKVYFLSALLTGSMPILGKIIMTATLGLGLKVGIIISALVFLFPPLACFGMISPMIIRLVSTDIKRVGKSAGTVYAISTLGGIIATFSMGFYLIPFQGLKFSSYATAIALVIFPVIYFFINRKK